MGGKPEEAWNCLSTSPSFATPLYDVTVKYLDLVSNSSIKLMVSAKRGSRGVGWEAGYMLCCQINLNNNSMPRTASADDTAVNYHEPVDIDTVEQNTPKRRSDSYTCSVQEWVRVQISTRT